MPAIQNNIKLIKNKKQKQKDRYHIHGSSELRIDTKIQYIKETEIDKRYRV